MFILYITSRYSHFNILSSKPCKRQYELLPSLGVRHLGQRMPSDGKSSHCLWQGELKRTKGQITIYKTLHKKQNIEQHEPH
jgi:hypothetical protein